MSPVNSGILTQIRRFKSEYLNTNFRSYLTNTKLFFKFQAVLYNEFMEPIKVPTPKFTGSHNRVPYKKVFSDKKIVKIFLKNNMRIHPTCKALKISVATWYNWLENNDNLREQVQTAREEMKDKIEKTLIERAEAGDTQILLFLAKTQLRDRGYGETETSQNNTQVNIVLPEDINKNYEWWGGKPNEKQIPDND